MNDNDLFREFFQSRYPALLGYARKVACFDEQDAEDGVLTSLSKKSEEIIQHLRSNRLSVLPGLWTVIRYEIINLRRKRLFLEPGAGPRMVVSAPDDFATLHDPTTPVTGDTVSQWEAVLARAFKHCRPPLSETERAVLRITELQQPPLSDTEAAAQLGTTEDVIKARRYSAKQKLRKFLAADGRTRPEELL